jgi:hypothetical protein
MKEIDITYKNKDNRVWQPLTTTKNVRYISIMSCEHSTCISGGLAEGIVKIGQHGHASRDYIYIYIYIYI